MTAEVLTSVYPPLLVFAAAVLVLVLPRALGAAVGMVALLGVLAVAGFAPSGEHLVVPFLGFEAHPFLVDDFTRLVGAGLGFLGAAAVLYGYSSGASRRLLSIALFYVGASVGAAFAGDWLVLVFMWELMALFSTLLIWLYGDDAVRAGYRYAIAHGIGGSLVLFAVTWHYAEVGTFVYGAETVGIAPGMPMLLAVLGIGVNVAFVGFHTWLPDSYPRPHFAASVFLAAYTTKTSAYVLYRAFPEGDLYLAYMGGLMAVYGVVFALLQHDMRALLSYHIQAQLGYMVAGIGIGSAIGVAGAMGHLFNNVLYKSLLFMAVGVIIYRTGKNDLYELGGLWREMPITAIAFAIGALSITAVPGFNGFISKGMVLDAADPGYYGAPEYQALWVLLLVGAVGTFLSFIKLGYYAFLHGPATTTVKDARTGQTVAMLSVGGLCVVLGLPGIGWPVFADFLPMVDGTTVPDLDTELSPYSLYHLGLAAGLVLVSVVGFRLIRKPLSRLEYSDPATRLHPLGFHASKLTVRVVTEVFAAVDRAAVELVRRCYWIGNHPASAVDRVGRRLPGVTAPDRRTPDGGHESTLHLRLSIGRTVLVVTVVLTLVLLVLL